MTGLLFVTCVVAGLLAALNLVALAIPRSWQVVRSIETPETPATIYPLIACLDRGWPRWSPWSVAADPSMQLTIVDAASDRRVGYRLTFGVFAIDGVIELDRAGELSRVQWSNAGMIAGLPMFRFARWFAPRVVGRAMERGLGQLVHAAASTCAAS